MAAAGTHPCLPILHSSASQRFVTGRGTLPEGQRSEFSIDLSECYLSVRHAFVTALTKGRGC